MGSKCQFDSCPLKVRNRPEICACRWCATYCWKDLNKGYNFALDLISIKGLNKKLWPSKMSKVLILKIWDSQLGSLGTKWHLDATPMANQREYYKGEGGGFFQVWAVVSLINPCMPMLHSCTKSAPAMHLTNLLFGLYMFVCIIDLLVTHPSTHPRALTHLFTPKVLRIKERTPTPLMFSFSNFAFECFKECGVHHWRLYLQVWIDFYTSNKLWLNVNLWYNF